MRADRANRGAVGPVVAAVGLAVVVVVLGAYTRLVDAGLGCPDWPGCYGHLGVPSTVAEVAAAEAAFPDAPVEVGKAWVEMIHRYAATALGALILVILGLAIHRGDDWRLPLGIAVLVIAQGAFGAWTVTLKLWPQVVTAHLLGGFATLALLWLLLLSRRPTLVSRMMPGGVPLGLKRLATASIAVVVLQVALGGWLTSNYAALACPDFPTCHGEWVPDMDLASGFDVLQSTGPNYLGGLLASDARVAIHFAHRVGAVAALLAVGVLTWRLGNTLGAQVLGGILTLQLALGIANVVFSLPLAVAVLHNAGGAALLLAVVGVRFAAGRKWTAVSPPP